jgi:hypothetical protein
MVYFQTQNPNLGKFLRAIRLENGDTCYGHLEYLTDILDILFVPFGTFLFIGNIFSGFGIMHQVKSGKPASAEPPHLQ